MANNYYDGTGVLQFNAKAILTPVLHALFGVFHLKDDHPGDDELYIALQAEDGPYHWNAVLEKFQEHAGDMGVALSVDEDPDDLAAWLRAMGRKLNCTTNAYEAKVAQVVGEWAHDAEAEAALSMLFDLAMCLQDGHNLQAIRFEGSWRSSQMRLFEFGGNGIFIGKHYREFNSSSVPRERAGAMDTALAQGDSDRAAGLLVERMNRLLDGICDEVQRKAVRAAVHQAMEQAV